MKTYFFCKKSFEDLLEQAANASEIPIIPDYSGRGMYGKTCFAVSGSPEEITSFLETSILIYKDFLLEDTMDSYEHNFYEVVHLLLSYSQDSLGLDRVIYWSKNEKD